MGERDESSPGFFQRLFAGRGEPTKYPDDLPSAGPARDCTGQIQVVVPEPKFATGQLPQVENAAPVTAQIMQAQTLAELTTMRVGGKFASLQVARSAAELAEHAARLWAGDEPWLLLSGGSNTIVSDAGFPGTVLLVRSCGIEEIADSTLPAGKVRVRVQAGQDWDELVAWAVAKGYAGIEMLSGIPGLAGAAPVQNIGAYGGELSQVLHSVTWYDRYLERVREIPAAELGLGYRDSVLKQGYEAVVLTIDLVLSDNSAGGAGSQIENGAETEPFSEPIVYKQLADALGVRLGARVPLAKVRAEVLRVRAKKGMVLNESDHNTWSCGSFFTNPVVSQKFARTLPPEAPRFAVQAAPQQDLVTTFQELAQGAALRLQDFSELPGAAGVSCDSGVDRRRLNSATGAFSAEPCVKLSAAWLIEKAGVPRGFRLPGSGAAVSDLHTLAITNQGGASAADVAELARYIVSMVQVEFGVVLVPEPNIYGLEI